MAEIDQKMNILVIGAGSWGTTLSVVLAEKENNIYLWARNKNTVGEINKIRKNEKYTQDLRLPSNIVVFNDIKEVAACPDIVIFAVPSHAMRNVIEYFYGFFKTSKKIRAIVNAAKGLETGTNLRLSEVMNYTLPMHLRDKVSVLSGPNISTEISQKLPSVSAIASNNHQLIKWLQEVLSTDYFRVYTNKDLAGVEIGGALKNIIAIAAGISDGLGYGTNTKASLVTRGLHEITRFGLKMGAAAQTFAGISGMGDLITTCFNHSSRNRLFGQKIASGQKPREVRESMSMVAEGFNTSQAVYQLAHKMHIDMPITESIYNVLYEQKDPWDSVNKLMGRKFKPEIEDF